MQVELDVHGRVDDEGARHRHHGAKSRKVLQALRHLLGDELHEIRHELVKTAVGGERVEGGAEEGRLAADAAAASDGGDAIVVHLEFLGELVRHHGLDDGTVGTHVGTRVGTLAGTLDAPGGHHLAGRDGRAEVRGAEHIRYEVFLGEGVGFSGMRGWTPSTASQCGTTLTAMGGRGSLAASTSLSSISLFSWMKTSGHPGTSRKGIGPAPAGKPYRDSTSRSLRDAFTSSVESSVRLEWRMNLQESWITSRRRYSTSGASARATSSGRDSIPTVCAMTLTDSGGTDSRSSTTVTAGSAITHGVGERVRGGRGARTPRACARRVVKQCGRRAYQTLGAPKSGRETLRATAGRTS